MTTALSPRPERQPGRRPLSDIMQPSTNCPVKDDACLFTDIPFPLERLESHLLNVHHWTHREIAEWWGR